MGNVKLRMNGIAPNAKSIQKMNGTTAPTAEQAWILRRKAMTDVREKLVELLCEAHSKATDAEAFADATYAQQLEMEADHLIANGVSIQRWIPVEERLPEDDGEYLAVGNYFGWWWAVLMFAKDGRKVDEYDFHERWENVWYDFDRDCGHCIYGSVTHWMPLPQTPKEDEND
jgi:hypothetical protein